MGGLGFRIILDFCGVFLRFTFFCLGTGNGKGFKHKGGNGHNNMSMFAVFLFEIDYWTLVISGIDSHERK